ncbi:MAG: hypothetical protein HY515_04325 [Candidatus Aenigmarchaeota archaeon]|nr:hypothetical protein [Candidatus Aenigmarchaeota archaeon]
MKRELSEEESNRIRRNGLDLSEKHLQMRMLARLDLYKIKKIFEEGKIYQVGNYKYRAVLRFGDVTAFMIFERILQNNVLKTVGVTRSKGDRWD